MIKDSISGQVYNSTHPFTQQVMRATKQALRCLVRVKYGRTSYFRGTVLEAEFSHVEIIGKKKRVIFDVEVEGPNGLLNKYKVTSLPKSKSELKIYSESLDTAGYAREARKLREEHDDPTVIEAVGWKNEK